VRPGSKERSPAPPSRPGDSPSSAARCARGDSADGPARPAGRDPDRGRCRNLKASRSRRHGREQPAGARVGSRLFGGLGGRRSRPAAAVAGDRGVRVEIRGASSLGSCQARERCPTWDARGRRRELASGGVAALRGPHASKTVKRRLASWSTLHRWKEGDRETVCCAEPALGPRRGSASARASGPSPGMSWIG
jgi:hypothetical protein